MLDGSVDHNSNTNHESTTIVLIKPLPHALFLLAVLPLISCTGIQPNYLTPGSSTTASVEFNDPNQFNRRVIIHGSDI
jgi:hypothetical protein